MTDWSPQQQAALSAVTEWFMAENAPQIFRLFGYAGTGKTTLAVAIAKIVRDLVKAEEGDAKDAVLYAAFTGKAALVLQSKGCRGASTIHSLIYTLDDPTSPVPRFVLNPASKLTDAKLLIVDEVSMVGAELAEDLLSFGVKILALGDPAQLPPVQDAGFFTNAKPDTMLTEVHRQAEGNPIIRLSMDIRNGVPLDYGDHGACRIVPWRKDSVNTEDVLGADQILVGRNQTRTRMNARYRELKKYKRETPLQGEKLVCLKNDRSKSLFNGSLWRVEKLRKFNPAAVRMVIAPEDAGEVARAVEVKLHPFFFEGREAELTWETLKEYQQMTYGYALTVHKAQGSQWNNVMLFNEAGVFRDDATRWLYTGVTRASEKLMVVM
jgi:exodeoxyribonuclease-5